MSARRRIWGVLLGVAALCMMTTPALADHLDISTSEVDAVEPGDIVELAVVVRSADTGQPVPGATVVATIEAEIVGVSGTVELARGITGDDGIATLRWQVRSGATESVVIAFSEAGEVVTESHPLSIVTVGSGRQIVRSESGIQIPGLGAWVLIAVLVLVWALIQFAMLGPVRVGLAAAADAREDEGGGT